MKKKIVVGLSGGVDSSVSAFLLTRDPNYDVEAVFMRNWDSMLNNDILGNNTLDGEICSQEQDYNDAKAVAKTLGIKLHRVDFISEYWEFVFKYFIDEYKNGRTPNPDVLCNKYIKFHEFLKYAIDHYHSDYIAMGHYARVRFNKKLQEFELLKGLDQNKDQTYFLCMLNQKQLSKVLFPIGELEKTKVREIAKANNLITAAKKDSTGICFIGERNFKEFLKNYIPSVPGDIVDVNSQKVVGKHDGIMYYTIGQRRGLNLGGMHSRYFVVGKNIDQKIIYVSDSHEQKWLFCNRILISDINFINKIYLDQTEIKCEVAFRYRQNPSSVKIVKNLDGSYEIISQTKLKSVTTGQYAVFYIGEVCIGGALISGTFNGNTKLEYLKF